MRFFKDLKKNLPYVFASARATLKSEVSGSYLNWIWWVLNPLCTMLIYVLVFGVVYEGREAFFSVFIFSGLTIWGFYNSTATGSVKIVKANKAIISRIYLPKYVLILELMAVNGFKMLISLCVVFLMLVFFKIPFTFASFYLLYILLTMACFTFGLSCLFLHWGVYVQDLSNVVRIVLRFQYFLSGIFFKIESRIPAPAGPWVLRLNPMALVLDTTRNALIDGQVSNLVPLTVWLCVGILLSVIGVHTIYKNENSYVKVI